MNENDDFLEELKQGFIEEAFDLLEKAGAGFLNLEKDPGNDDILAEIFRLFHNIKGSAKAVGFSALSDFAHKAEDLLVSVREKNTPFNPQINDTLLACNDGLIEGLELLKTSQETSHIFDPILKQIEAAMNGELNDNSSEKIDDSSPKTKAKPAAKKKAKPSESQGTPAPTVDETIKLPIQRISTLLDHFGEQVILQSKLSHLMSGQVSQDRDEINATLRQLEKITNDLQQTVISLRMVNLTTVFNRMERTVRDIARQSGKQVEFIRVGEASELDKIIVDSLTDPLTHMVRNAVDHGLETTEERDKTDKPKKGSVTLKAYRQAGFFYIEVEDDGRGLDRSKLIKKAEEKGLISEGDELTDNEAFQLIFHSGFSTKDKVSDVSGRGVGMDVVREMFNRLKGTCEIESQLGKGSRFIIRLPLTLALFNGTLIGLGHQKFIIPNSDYYETVALTPDEVQGANKGQEITNIKGRVMSVIPLIQALGFKASSEDKGKDKIAAIARHDNREYAILFDELLSQEKIVLKKLGPEAAGVPGVSGGTILGDGSVALVLELKELIEKYQQAG